MTHVVNHAWVKQTPDAFSRLLGLRVGQNSICHVEGLDPLPFTVLPRLNKVGVDRVTIHSTTPPFSSIFLAVVFDRLLILVGVFPKQKLAQNQNIFQKVQTKILKIFFFYKKKKNFDFKRVTFFFFFSAEIEPSQCSSPRALVATATSTRGPKPTLPLNQVWHHFGARCAKKTKLEKTKIKKKRIVTKR